MVNERLAHVTERSLKKVRDRNEDLCTSEAPPSFPWHASIRAGALLEYWLMEVFLVFFPDSDCQILVFDFKYIMSVRPVYLD